jgi:hypothetical protein
MRRTALALLAIGGLALVAATASAVFLQPDPNGPLGSTSKTTVSYPVDVSRPVTWGIPIRNPADAPIQVESVELTDVHGLDIVAVRVSSVDPSTGSGSLVIEPGWPPDGVVLRDVRTVAGAIMPVLNTGDPDLQFLIVAQRSAADQVGTIAGVRIRYLFEKREYEAQLPWGLELSAPVPSASSPSG